MFAGLTFIIRFKYSFPRTDQSRVIHRSHQRPICNCLVYQIARDLNAGRLSLKMTFHYRFIYRISPLRQLELKILGKVIRGTETLNRVMVKLPENILHSLSRLCLQINCFHFQAIAQPTFISAVF